jgi:hypothetical protein
VCVGNRCTSNATLVSITCFTGCPVAAMYARVRVLTQVDAGLRHRPHRAARRLGRRDHRHARLSSWPKGMRLVVRKQRPDSGAQLCFTDSTGCG